MSFASEWKQLFLDCKHVHERIAAGGEWQADPTVTSPYLLIDGGATRFVGCRMCSECATLVEDFLQGEAIGGRERTA